MTRGVRGARWRSRAAISSLVLGLGSSQAHATDPRIGLRLASAVSRSPAPSERLSRQGTNQTSALLPLEPKLVWQTRLAPPLVGELAADEHGGLLAAHAGDRLTSLDERGHAAWSLRLGAELVSGPIPLGGGGSLAITRDGRLARVSERGAIEGREAWPFGPIDAAVVAVSTSDGGALIAVGSRLARVGPNGTQGFSSRLPDPVRALFEWRSQTIAVGHAGAVFARGIAGDPHLLASFDEPVRAVALVGDRLLAISKRALLELDLVSKQHRVAWSDGSTELRDFAALGSGELRLVGGHALLVATDGSGHELSRYSLPPAESGGELADIVADRAGRLWLTAPGAPISSFNPQGEVTSVPGSGCPDPLRPTPLADGLAIAACRSGVLRAFSDKAR